MNAKYILINIVLVFCALESLLFYLCHGKSGGDLAFQIFSTIFLVFYGIILWAVSESWGISKNLVVISFLISALLLLITLKIV
jgi:hypothetical protein